MYIYVRKNVNDGDGMEEERYRDIKSLTEKNTLCFHLLS